MNFHGKELYSGSNRLRGWSQADRHAAASEFLKLVPKYGLPIRYYALDKPEMAKLEFLDFDRREEPYFDHQFAWLATAFEVEKWFCANAPTERGFCIADETKAKPYIQYGLRGYREAPRSIDNLKLDHLIDTVYFGDSRTSIFLQLADVCAFL